MRVKDVIRFLENRSAVILIVSCLNAHFLFSLLKYNSESIRCFVLCSRKLKVLNSLSFHFKCALLTWQILQCIAKAFIMFTVNLEQMRTNYETVNKKKVKQTCLCFYKHFCKIWNAKPINVVLKMKMFVSGWCW